MPIRLSLLVVFVGLLMLTSCGGSSGEMTSGVPPASNNTPQLSPIERQAECAFPQTMQVGRPATVRFSVFTPGNRPNALPDANVAVEPLQLQARPDLQVWVAVTLAANGTSVDEDAERQFQQLSERSNIWIWQVTPTTPGSLVLQPTVDVEYRDASGNVIDRQSNVWTQTYVVEDVVGSSYLNVATSWIGDSISELITGAIGALLVRVGATTRERIGQRFGQKNV